MSSVLETGPASVTAFTGFIQSTGGKFVVYDADSSELQLADEASTVFATSESGVLQMADVPADLYFELDDSTQRVFLRTVGEHRPGTFSLGVQRLDEHTVMVLASDGKRCLAPHPNGTSLTLLPKPRQAGSVSFVLIEQPAPRNVGLSERGCCTLWRSPSHIEPMWKDLGHHALVDAAVAFLTSRSGVAEERLMSLWQDETFKASVFKGLRDADYVNPYNDGGLLQGAWRSHFYDPDTRTNYRGESDRTALTEGLKYYQQSMAAPDLRSAGFNLGLVLHYYSDLTQPMHAANFAEIYGRLYLQGKKTFTGAHSFFEKVGDEVIKRSPPTLHENFAYRSDLSAAALFLETARQSKAAFNRLSATIPNLDCRCIRGPEGIADRKALRPIMTVFARDALQAGLEQIARFLYTWAAEFHAMAYNPAGTRWRVREMTDDGSVGSSPDELWEFGPVLLRAGGRFGGYRPLPDSDCGYLVEQFERGTCEVYFVSPTRFISVKEGKIWRFGELAAA